ncbi:uncharacterized protein LOC112905355 isoform X2 [Agrilus planipennis]|uniref:Uncharacterized protein LOC112905355 isoform X2 n=1 Tax=Agrilus planipennis TaxID=224129 RepID=A0A7F5RBK2_AGRPL|nr:uncharacterized protein LOC112905355 isoform X2 [Agrilus planipennis]
MAIHQEAIHLHRDTHHHPKEVILHPRVATLHLREDIRLPKEVILPHKDTLHLFRDIMVLHQGGIIPQGDMDQDQEALLLTSLVSSLVEWTVS